MSQPNTAIIRILSKDSKNRDTAVGAGFLVSNDYIVTCAHVIADVLGIPRDTQDMPGNEAVVRLDFPLVAPGQIVSAKIVEWYPMHSQPSHVNPEDIALLKPIDALPTGVSPTRLLKADILLEHSFRAFGFPKGYDDGVWARGVIIDNEGKGLIQIDGYLDSGVRVEPGFSGTMVWDDQLNGVVGMVVSADIRPQVKLAFMMPATTLITLYPLLSQQAIYPSPYKGLFAFSESDARFFFGRETVITALNEAVRKRALVAVVGASGSGKSSVVRAGLIPVLRKEAYVIISFHPGDRPFYELASALVAEWLPEKSGSDQRDEIDKLTIRLQQNHDGYEFSDIVEDILRKKASEHFLIFIDQFEEIYTNYKDIKEKKQFLNQLITFVNKASRQHPLKWNLVFTLRADFLGDALSYRAFADVLQNADLKLAPMSRSELQRVIEQPAAEFDVQIETSLTQRILDIVSEDSGTLPLLEFTMNELWPRQQGKKLRYAEYEDIGGVEEALANYAETVYDGLKEEDKKRTQQIFVQLVNPSTAVKDIRRIAKKTDFTEENWKLVQQLAASRLIVTNIASDGLETAELVHEALIRNWISLREWLQIDSSFRIWQEQFRTQLQIWLENKQDESGLLRGGPLEHAMDWLKKKEQIFTQMEKNFIFESILNEDNGIQEWIPLYGPIEETLAFLRAYYNKGNETARLKSIEALRWLPYTDQEMEIYAYLQQVLFNEPSLLSKRSRHLFQVPRLIADISTSLSDVQGKAAWVIYERGHIHLLVGQMASKELSLSQRKWLIQALAYLYNHLTVGEKIKKFLRYNKMQIKLTAARQLISEYSSVFATSIFFAVILGQVSQWLIVSLLFPILGFLNQKQDITYPFDFIDLSIILLIGLYLFIRSNVINQKSLSFFQCFLGALFASLFLNIFQIFDTISQWFVTGLKNHETLPSLIFEIINIFPKDILIFFVIMLYINVMDRYFSFRKITLVAVIVPCVALVSDQLLSPLLFSLQDIMSSGQFLFSPQFPDITSSIITWIAGTFMLFGTLLGFHIGFRSSKIEREIKPQ